MEKLKRLRGKSLQNIIEQSGYTIAEFCKESKIPSSTLYAYLSGEREPSFKNVASIAKTLKISLKSAAILLNKDITGIPNDQ